MRIVHLADLHLGYRQYGMPERTEDFMVAVAYIFQKAIELKADVINLGGDIFHADRPPAACVLFLHNQIAKVKAAGIKVVGVDGNHDCTESAWLTVCGLTPLDVWNGGVPVIQDVGGVAIAGVNGGRPGVVRAALDRLVAAKPSIDVLAMHLPLAEMAGFEGVEMSARDIAEKVAPLGVRLVILGDLHDYKETVFNGIRFIYSGSVEMTALDEQPSKVFSVIDINGVEMKTATHEIPVRTVLHSHIDNDDDLHNLLSDIQKATVDPRRPPLAIVSYNPDLVGMRKKLTSMLTDRALHRVLPASSASSVDVFKQLAERSDEYERKGAMRNLRTIVTDKFGEEDDRSAMVLAMIEKPEEVERLMLQYANSKDLKIK